MITIPPRFKNLLDGVTDEISVAVGIAISNIYPFLERNEAIFFPDFTDHGIAHIESVLKSCELLISEEGWSIFTREDAAALIVSVLCHDLGMLIDVDGFRFMVDHSKESEALLSAQDEPWEKLWREFQLDVRRFDGPTLTCILGTPEPISMQELDITNVTERSAKIIGEFLRRYHHRVAHEIAVYGMPSGNGRAPLLNNVLSYIKDTSARIARSHGIPIRDCLDLFSLVDRNAYREYRNIHPTFLMALIRLADYLDLDMGRVPLSILAAKTLKSPISKREWWSHRSILDCHSYDADPECLHVIIEPSALPDVLTLSIVEEKLTGIQKELDSSWAVLGEVYGRFPPLNKLSLRIRRIRSDINDSSKITQLPFVPHKAALESTRADLLKLLIEPLYGDNPGIGIRELVQNAIDAVREYDFIAKDMTSPVDRAELEGDVVINFEQDERNDYWIKVSDRGIGMTWQTVLKFYLTAGASFRQSDVWKKRFTDEEGESQVLRSGRFGIGVLAAFLLGDRVVVSTRHIEEPPDKGIEFEFSLHDMNIELRWTKRDVGTTIKVRTSKKIITELIKSRWDGLSEWDWYYLQKPKLIVYDLAGDELKSRYKLPDFNTAIPIDWHIIRPPGLQAIFWTFRKDFPHLICNGIFIPHGYISLRDIYPDTTHLRFNTPKTSVFDSDGRFPLNLARDRVARTPTNSVQLLAEDVARNFIAFCLYRGPHDRLISENQFSIFSHLNYPSMDAGYYYKPSWIFDTPTGFGLSDPWNISYFISSIGLLIRLKTKYFQISKSIAETVFGNYTFLYGTIAGNTLEEFDTWHRLLASSLIKGDGLTIFNSLDLKGVRILMPKAWFQRFTEKQRKYVLKKIYNKTEYENIIIFTFGDCPDNEERLFSLASDLLNNGVNIESLTECYFNSTPKHPEPGQVAKIWKEAIGGPIIPFDMNERQRIIESLDDKYKHHVEQWASEDKKMRIRRQ